MSESNGLDFRAAESADARAVAELHADSWRRHYRGAYSDEFLDGEVGENRFSVWSDRLSKPGPCSRTILAERRGELVGLAHAVLDEDVAWGALLDNLHVVHHLKRRGIGAKLLAMTARAVLDTSPQFGLYLWVLEQNTDAQELYASRGGVCVGRKLVPPPEGHQARLRGRRECLRYAWRDPSKLLVGLPSRPS